ncbi:hypothetical protein LCGC14_1686230, partial [marine sediment metagenome]
YSLIRNQSDEATSLGFSAQDVKVFFPHLVSESNLQIGKLRMDKAGMVPVLWQIVKQLKNRIVALEAAP